VCSSDLMGGSSVSSSQEPVLDLIGDGDPGDVGRRGKFPGCPVVAEHDKRETDIGAMLTSA